MIAHRSPQKNPKRKPPEGGDGGRAIKLFAKRRRTGGTMEHIQNIAWIGFFITASAMDGEHWEELLVLCGIFLAVAVGIDIITEFVKERS